MPDSMEFPQLEKIDKVLTLENLVTDFSEIFRYGSPPVPIQQFLDDDFYFGKIAKDLYPANRADLEDIFDPKNTYLEVILTGATSIGKTFMASIAVCYIIYQLSCFKNPHKWLGASPASPIVLINMSINAQKAKEVIFTRVKTMVDISPYFKDVFKRDMRLVDSLVWRLSGEEEDIKNRTGAQIQFKPGTGDSLSALGDDIYAGIGDELNFFRVVEKSKRAYGEAFDPAQRLYDVISRRMKGRFSKQGMALGKFFLLSSAQYPDDFIERRIKEAEESGELGKTVKVIRKSIWEAKKGVTIQGMPVFSDKTFRVEVGSSVRGSRFLDKYDKKTGQIIDCGLTDITGKVLFVPVELYDDFERDIEGAVRDFGGEVTRAIQPFFSDVASILSVVSDDIPHPWSKEICTSGDGSYLEIGKIFEKTSSGVWQLKRNPAKFRYAHVDLGKSVDAAGVAIVHICGWKKITKQGVEYDVPIYETDLLLRIQAPVGGEIQFSAIREIFYLLRDYGMHFGKITYDQFQSTDSIQELRGRNFPVDLLSVDRDIAPYQYLKDCFSNKQLIIYRYDPVLLELMRLEKKENKVDHPPGGSKDVSDALCGAVWNAYTDAAHFSEKDIFARLPQAVERKTISMLKKSSTIQEQSSLEEEMREFLGGAKKVK